MSRSKPKISRRGNSWRVDFGRVNGKRIIRQFQTKAEAQAAITERQLEKQNKVVALSGLSDLERTDVIRAVEKLAGRATLEQAVDFYMEHSAPAQARSLKDCLSEYIQAKERANLRPRSLAEIRGRLGAFVLGQEQRGIHEFTTQDLIAWLNAQGFSNASRDKYLTQLIAIFNFAVKNGYRVSNPAKPIEKSHRDETLPEIHTAKEAERILKAAAKIEPLTVPYFALGYFAGLRPENELAGLDWQDIDLEGGYIRVRPETAKRRRQRYVEISDNLKAWLLPYRQDRGKIRFRRKRVCKVREKAGVAWSGDVMRHTFASMHLAHFGDIQKTTLQLGHTDANMLFNKYRNLVKPAEAKRFWNITPPKQEGNVVEFQRASA